MVTILDAISKGADSKRKLLKHLSYVEPKVVGELIEKALEEEFITKKKRFLGERFLLTKKGLEELSKLKVTTVYKKPSSGEILTDKVIGAILMIGGIFVFYYAFNLSLELMFFIENFSPEASMRVEAIGSIQAAIASAFAPYISKTLELSLKAFGIFILVMIGGKLLDSGVKLFKRT